MCGHAPCLAALRRAGVDIHSRTSFENGHWSALHLAAYNGQVEAIDFLLDAGLEIEAVEAEASCSWLSPLAALRQPAVPKLWHGTTGKH